MIRRNLLSTMILASSLVASSWLPFGTRPADASPVVVTVYEDDFETGVSDRWVSGGTFSTWAAKEDPAGNGYLTDSPNGTYVAGTNSNMRLIKPLNLEASYSSCTLRFIHIIDTELEVDRLWLEASGNASEWGVVKGWSGSSGGRWVTQTESMSAWIGQKSLYLRFRLQDNGSDGNNDGVSIDDLSLVCETSGSPSPTPTTTTSVSPSPTPSPSPTCSATIRCQALISLTITKTTKQIRLSGLVDPPHPGASVKVSLLRKRNGRFRPVVKQALDLDAESRYAVALSRPRPGTCKAKAYWPGDTDHGPSLAAYKFTC